MTIKHELRRLVGRLRNLEACEACGVSRAKRAPPLTIGHPGTLAVRNCPRCGGGLASVFTLVIGDHELAVPPKQMEERARRYIADGVTPAQGWALRPDIAAAMARVQESPSGSHSSPS